MMKKRTNWEEYYKQQTSDPGLRQLVEDEIKMLRIGVQLAILRQEKGLTQTQLAAKVGMSAPNISRIESSPAQNLTLGTLVKLFGALDHEVTISPRKRPRRRAVVEAREREILRRNRKQLTRQARLLVKG
jgi:transcriptional regulator with XRE-family HTH domain